MWVGTAGLTIRKADSLEGFSAFLKRNPGLSWLVEVKGKVVGGILGSQDGRFGYIHHLVVLPEFHQRGIGKQLLKLCLDRIKSTGVEKCHIFINRDNPQGLEFWKKQGWTERADLSMASITFDAQSAL